MREREQTYATQQNGDAVDDAVEKLDEAVPEPQPPANRLTDEQIENCIDAANRAFNERESTPRGQMCSVLDDWKHWLAREVERSVLMAAPQPQAEPVAWMGSPHGAVRLNPAYRWTAPQSVKWSIPLYAHPAGPPADTEERDLLLTMLDGIVGAPCPTPTQWRDIEGQAKRLRAAVLMDRERR